MCIAIILIGCEKDQNNPASFEKSDWQGNFRQDIIIQDYSGENTVFLGVYADDEQDLSNYLKNAKFKLITSDQELEPSEVVPTDYLKSTEGQNKDYNLNENPKVIVDLITYNLQANVRSFYLDVEIKSSVKSTEEFLIGDIFGYTTANDFIGVSHLGWGYEFAARPQVKWNWYSSWDDFNLGGGANTMIIYGSGAYTYLFVEYSSYRLRMTIYQHYFQNQINHRIAYSRNEFRGQECTIGSYDGANCYIGTAPNGTTAYIYPNSSGAFYYSPINGNQCPYPGSYYDNANCYVLDIPPTCVGFIYNNSWYVQPDMIL